MSRSLHQPRSNFKFPKRSYRPKNVVQRSFQHSSANSILVSPEVSRSPHQPRSNFKFPKRSYRPKNVVQRSFQHSSANSILESPEVSRSPHQPRSNFKFPKRSYGLKNAVQRSFQHSWFKQWPLFHYDEVNDVAYCHLCIMGFKQDEKF